MSGLQYLGDDGEWHDFPGFYRDALGPPDTTDNGDGTYTHVWSIEEPPATGPPAVVMFRDADGHQVIRPHSDDAAVSLADDETYHHMRSLYPGPEHFEGR